MGRINLFRGLDKNQEYSVDNLSSDMEEVKFEEVYRRFPLLGERILKEVDYHSLTKCKVASREISEFLDNGRLWWKQMILRAIAGNNDIS